MQPIAGRERAPRVALYSHDTQGLGHVRRNLLIARSLAEQGGDPVIMLLSGVHEAAWFDFPTGVDCITLPSLAKNAAGGYEPRTLGVPIGDLIRIRQGTLQAALESFEPDVFIVDKVPLGAFDELEPSLSHLRRQGRTRVVLGLREILDDPAKVADDWRRSRFQSAVRRYFDQIWVYGDRAVYDLVEEYAMAPDLASRVRFTGYLNPFGRVDAPADDAPSKTALCLVGGGRDGVELGRAFLQTALPAGWHGRLITGPLMPGLARDELAILANRSSQHTIIDFVTDPLPWMRDADRIIAMGGYNTMCEIVACGVPSLIVPRVAPRSEQLIRARRFAELGLVDVIHPDALTPESLDRWLATPHQRRAAADSIDFDGADRLPRLVEALLDQATNEGRHHVAG